MQNFSCDWISQTRGLIILGEVEEITYSYHIKDGASNQNQLVMGEEAQDFICKESRDIRF